VTFWIKVSLDNYANVYPVNAVQWQPIQIMLQNCQVTDFTFPAQANVNYIVYTPIIYVPMSHFAEIDQAGFIRTGSSCGYSISYTVTWQNYWGTAISLPSFISWNPTLFRFEIQSSDAIDFSSARQFYTLQLTASISSSDMNPPFSKTQTFNLTADSACLGDQVTVLTGIADYTYYINENTEKGTWVYGLTPKPKLVVWQPTWSQSVGGCPVDAKLYRVINDRRV
jgi:hypothetical protein